MQEEKKREEKKLRNYDDTLARTSETKIIVINRLVFNGCDRRTPNQTIQEQ